MTGARKAAVPQEKRAALSVSESWPFGAFCVAAVMFCAGRYCDPDGNLIEPA